MKTWALILVGGLLLLARPAAAYDTTNTALPSSSIVGADDAQAAVVNPAGLGVQGGFEFEYFHGFNGKGANAGDGLFLRFPYLGFAFQAAYPDEDRTWTKYTIPLGLELGRVAGMAFYTGANFSIVDSIRPADSPDVDAAVGFLWWGWNAVALGISGSNLLRPEIADRQHQAALTLAAGLRPLTNRVSFTADFTWVQNEENPAPIFRTRLEPLNGVVLTGFIDTKAAWGAGLGLDFAHFGVRSDMAVGSDAKFDGLVLGLRASTIRYHNLVEPAGHLILIAVDDKLQAEQDRPLFNLPFFSSGKKSLLQITEAIRRAANDKGIDGIVLRISPNELTLAELGELRSELQHFREASYKRIFAYLDTAGNKEYYLATVAEEIWISPGGQLELNGLSAGVTYFKGTMDWLGIEVEPIRAGKYKAAVEPFTRTTPSPEASEAMNAVLDDTWKEFLPALAEQRKLKPEEIEKLINEEAVFSPNRAKEKGLLDGVAYFDELEDVLEQRMGKGVAIIEGYEDRLYKQYEWYGKPRIAVVEIDGTIVYGDSGFNLFFGDNAGSNAIIAALKKVREDPNVRAVVLRVDSPGGSGLASDLILREVQLTQKKKPVIVSMGSTAASGGYYVACGADAIVASPTTVTGSIGAFSLKLRADELLGKLGLSHVTYRRGEQADSDSAWRGYTPQEKANQQRAMDDFYQQFLRQVATGRHMAMAKVDEVGQGRIWTGAAAKDKGLVDELGGLSYAIRLAKQKAGIADDWEVEIIILPESGWWLTSLVGGLKASSELPKDVRKALSQPEKAVHPLAGEKGLYWMPYEVKIE